MASTSSSGEQPIAANVDSVSRSITSSLMPVSRSIRSRNASELSAARQASVAMVRNRLAPLARILSPHTLRALTAREMAASLIRPVEAMPSPSRMMRENESITRNPSWDTRAISKRQLLVPRSSAAYAVGMAGARFWPRSSTSPVAGPDGLTRGSWPSCSRTSSFMQIHLCRAVPDAITLWTQSLTAQVHGATAASPIVHCDPD